MKAHTRRGILADMIERLDDMPEGTIGFRVKGELTRDDYETVLLPQFRETIERGDDVRLVFQLGPGFEKFTPGALMADTKTGLTLGLGHLSSWKRTALVTDIDWVRHTVEMLGWMTPGEVRLFKHNELTDAKLWAAG